MKMHRRFLVTCAAVVGLSGNIKAAPLEIALEIYSQDFIYFSDQSQSVGANTPSGNRPAPALNQPVVSGFSISFESFAVGTQEIPESKVQFQGNTYTIPARKIIVPGPRPDGEGVFVESALDPNGTGDFEVLLVVNRLGETRGKPSNEDPALNEESLPKGIRVHGVSSSSSTRNDRRELLVTMIFRNETGGPFVLKPEHFKHLTETKDWPLIEIPPLCPQV